jgi:hypothetical protein
LDLWGSTPINAQPRGDLVALELLDDPQLDGIPPDIRPIASASAERCDPASTIRSIRSADSRSSPGSSIPGLRTASSSTCWRRK